MKKKEFRRKKLRRRPRKRLSSKKSNPYSNISIKIKRKMLAKVVANNRTIRKIKNRPPSSLQANLNKTKSSKNSKTTVSLHA